MSDNLAAAYGALRVEGASDDAITAYYEAARKCVLADVLELIDLLAEEVAEHEAAHVTALLCRERVREGMGL